MIARDHRSKIVAQIEHLRDAQGNLVDTVPSNSNQRLVVERITVRDTKGRVESKTILNGKLLP